MLKNFDHQYLNLQQFQNQNHDPFINQTEAVAQEIADIQKQIYLQTQITNILANVILAPLITISASLQLSVAPHKDIFQQPAAKTKALSQLNTSLTIQQKRKLQLVLRSGSDFKPYVAPVYQGYWSTIKGLYNQGFKAFYKGLSFRTYTQFIRYFAFSYMPTQKFKTIQEYQQQSKYRIVKLYVFLTCLNIFNNAMFIGQNRYILQNNIPQFKGNTKNKQFTTVLKDLPEKLDLNNSSFVDLFARIPCWMDTSKQRFIAFYAAEIINYPLNTAFRRITCQAKDTPGMIPLRYKGIFHALRLIGQQQGILGLYKGFGFYNINILSKLGLFQLLNSNWLRNQN